MYIVYETDNNAEQLRTKYLVLELDTLEFPDGRVVRALGVIDSEHVPLQEIQLMENVKDLHGNLIKNYRERNWNFCKQAIDHLKGKFKGEMDSFYDELSERIQTLEECNLPEDWSPNIKVTTETD